jgi:ligand-binding SRPBCC domain-containing protein
MPFVAPGSAGVINDRSIGEGGEMADKVYTLTFAQHVPRQLPEVFAFFSLAENLEAITPSWLHFKILAVTPELQRRGPYKLWRHEHYFEARDGGTLITDMVSLALPLGILGHIAYKVRVHAQVKEIFTFRENKIRALFG